MRWYIAADGHISGHTQNESYAVIHGKNVQQLQPTETEEHLGDIVGQGLNSTGFGLLIAFLLPGLAAFYALSIFVPEARTALQKFTTVEANVGLFFLIVLASLALGLIVTVIRWIFYERFLGSTKSIPTGKFANLSDPQKFASFEGAVNQHYRYHQFWGGMTVVMPFIYGGWAYHSEVVLASSTFFIVFFVFLGIEAATFFAAQDAYSKYVDRASQILQ